MSSRITRRGPAERATDGRDGLEEPLPTGGGIRGRDRCRQPIGELGREPGQLGQERRWRVGERLPQRGADELGEGNVRTGRDPARTCRAARSPWGPPRSRPRTCGCSALLPMPARPETSARRGAPASASRHAVRRAPSCSSRPMNVAGRRNRAPRAEAMTCPVDATGSRISYSSSAKSRLGVSPKSSRSASRVARKVARASTGRPTHPLRQDERLGDRLAGAVGLPGGEQDAHGLVGPLVGDERLGPVVQRVDPLLCQVRALGVDRRDAEHVLECHAAPLAQRVPKRAAARRTLPAASAARPSAAAPRNRDDVDGAVVDPEVVPARVEHHDPVGPECPAELGEVDPEVVQPGLGGHRGPDRVDGPLGGEPGRMGHHEQREERGRLAAHRHRRAVAYGRDRPQRLDFQGDRAPVPAPPDELVVG